MMDSVETRANEPGFDLFVDGGDNEPGFQAPPGWQSKEHTVAGLGVRVLSRLPDAVESRRRAFGIPIITFHDIGMNAATCFRPFFTFCRMSGSCPELDAAYAHFHITAPGHTHDAPTLPSSTSVAIPDLVKGVEKVIERFGVTRAIGFGVGIGATILLRAAVALPSTFAGLVLVSPVLFPAGYIERASVAMEAVYARGLGLGRRAKDRFLIRWLSQETCDTNHDLTQIMEDGLDRLNTSNLVRFMSSEAWREDASHIVANVKSKVLLISGKQSPLHHHSAECFASFKPEMTSWLDIDGAGSLLLEENPERVARALSLYLQGFGEYTAPPSTSVLT